MKEKTIAILRGAQVNESFIQNYTEKTEDTFESNQEFWKDVIKESTAPSAKLGSIDSITSINDMTETLLLDYVENELIKFASK